LLPFILVFIVILARDQRLMGRYRNGTWVHSAAWITTIVLTLLALAMVVLTLRDWH
jgi:Mn2+/Fe2+ NRAMP family transporter